MKEMREVYVDGVRYDSVTEATRAAGAKGSCLSWYLINNRPLIHHGSYFSFNYERAHCLCTHYSICKMQEDFDLKYCLLCDKVDVGGKHE